MANQTSACNCIGPINDEPFCPCMMLKLGIFKRGDKWVEPEKVVGDVKPTINKMPFSQKCDSPCTDFRHNPPMSLYIESGETYVHVCPSCGAARSITDANIMFNEEDEDTDAFSAESNDEVKGSLKVK